MLLRKTVDDRGQQPARDRLGRSDPYLAGRRIGEVLDILDALSQFLECAQASPQQSTPLAVRSRSRTPIACSMSAIAFDTDGCETASRSAALPMLPSSATVSRT